MHVIEFDADRKLLVATCVGFWSEGDQQAFAGDLLTKLDHHCRRASLDLLFDVTAQPVQSAHVVEQQGILSAQVAKRDVRRMAIIVTSRLLNNQLSRVRRDTEGGSLARPMDVRYFDGRGEADRWLNEPRAQTQSAG